MVMMFALYIYAVGFMAAAMRATSRDSKEEHPIIYATFWPFTAALMPLLRYEAELFSRRVYFKACKETQRHLAAPIVDVRNCRLKLGESIEIDGDKVIINGNVVAKCRCNGGSEPCPLPPSQGPLR